MSANQPEIKIPYAIKNGDWIHISQVESGLKANCTCPCCNKTLLAKKGQKVIHHFAHYQKADCQPESVLHFFAKNFLFQKIKKHIESNLPLNVLWYCKFCERKHEANLLRRAAKLQLEYKLSDCKPDIALLSDENKPVAVVEIVVTHKPEKSALDFYQKNKIAVVEYDVSDGTDLEQIQSSESINASRVDQCTNPRCEKCERPFRDKIILFVVSDSCRRCKRPMKICFVRPNECDFRGPKDFNASEISIAKENGVLLEKHFSQTRNETYLANTCSQCRQWIGEYHLHNYIPDQTNEKIDWEEFLIGHYCFTCNREQPCEIKKIRNARLIDLPKQIPPDYSQLNLFG